MSQADIHHRQPQLTVRQEYHATGVQNWAEYGRVRV